MAHRIRWYLTGVLFDITIRTLHGTFWLRPDAACRAIVNGVLGKALSLYKSVRLHAFDAQSNHLHYLLSATKPAEIPLFLDYVHGNIARQINKLRGRTGTFWSRRGAVIAVIDDGAQVDRFTYIVAQGTAAGLVVSPKEWPGASSTAALLGDMRVAATYTSLDVARRNAQRAKPLPATELAEDVSFTLAPLPTWAHLAPAALRARHAEVVKSIVATHRRRAGTVLGAAAVCRQSPERTPKTFVRSPMPRCHASSQAARRRFDTAYRAFRETYLRAAERLRDDPKVSRVEIQRLYPPGSLARPHWYIPPPAGFHPPWQRGHDDADRAAVRL